jgi:hypothetical protein
MRWAWAIVVVAAAGMSAPFVAAVEQRTDAFVESIKHPSIAYLTTPAHDAITELDGKLRDGSVRLAFDRDSGYLRSVLDTLKVPVASQSLVFSQGSAQGPQIAPRNPRAVYFSDTVAVGWVRGADTLELAAVDPQQGVVFYTLDQKASSAPRPKRDNSCLLCHLTWDTLGVPGLQMLSTFQMSDDPNAYANGLTVDHRTPFGQRFGGWYVTGKPAARHLGNVPVIVKKDELGKPHATPQFETIAGVFDTRGFPASTSDIAALMVLAHQAHLTNLITRVGWEARVATTGGGGAESRATRPSPGDSTRVPQAAADLVDYMLFVDEAPFPGRIDAASLFADSFAAQGPRDKKGRSLRQLDLTTRLLRYPCSYMIYTPAFDALPPAAKSAVYRRLWQVLSGEAKDPRYLHLSREDRQAVLEILRDTKKDLPEYFRPQP